eukprot:RCo045433
MAEADSSPSPKGSPTKSRSVSPVSRTDPNLSPGARSEARKLSPRSYKTMLERLASRPKKAPVEKTPEWYRESAKINPEDEEKLVDRLYIQTMKQREIKLKQKVDAVYKYEPPKQVSEEKIQEMVKRMTDAEVERRQKQAASLQAKYLPEAPEKRLPHEQVEETSNRLYGSSKQRMEKQKKLEEMYTFKPKHTSKQVTPEELTSSVDRLAKPKASDFSTHPLFGATHGM